MISPLWGFSFFHLSFSPTSHRCPRKALLALSVPGNICGETHVCIWSPWDGWNDFWLLDTYTCTKTACRLGLLLGIEQHHHYLKRWHLWHPKFGINQGYSTNPTTYLSLESHLPSTTLLDCFSPPHILTAGQIAVPVTLLLYAAGQYGRLGWLIFNWQESWRHAGSGGADYQWDGTRTAWD